MRRERIFLREDLSNEVRNQSATEMFHRARHAVFAAFNAIAAFALSDWGSM